MQLAIDGLIALVVVISHLVILARTAFLDIFHLRYIPFVIVVTQVKWLAQVLWNIDIPDVLYLLVFIFIEKPQASTVEKLFYAFFAPVFWVTMTGFYNFYLFRVFFNQPIELIPHHLGILLVDCVVLPLFLGLQKIFSLDSYFKNLPKEMWSRYQKMLLRLDILLLVCYLVILFHQELQSLFMSQPYLSGYHQIYIWSGIMVHLYILICFVTFSKEIRDREIMREQEEHLRSLESYNEKIEAAYKSVRSFKHDYENVLISMQTSIDSGNFAVIEQTYQDILKKAGQELVENSEEPGFSNSELKEQKEKTIS